MTNIKSVILLTGTINVRNIINTLHTNASQRKSEYISAIQFYLNEINNDIVFVENSNENISEYFTYYIKNGRLEIITFLGNKYDSTLGKSYGEMEIIEFAFKNSKKIKSANYIIKITGRYKILNLLDLDIINHQNINCVISSFYWKLNMMDSRLFAGPKTFFENYLIPNKYLINESKIMYFEHILAKSCLRFISESNHLYQPYNKLPRIKGIYGTLKVNYNSNLSYYCFRNSLYRFKIFIQKKLNRN